MMKTSAKAKKTSRDRRVDDLLVVRLEGRPAEPADNRLSTGPPQNMSVPNIGRDAEDIAGDDEGRREWPPQTPSQIISHSLGPSGYCTWVGLGGSSRPLSQEKSAWRCGVQIRGGRRNPLWGVSPLGTLVKKKKNQSRLHKL